MLTFLPKVHVSDRALLPRKPGIYYAIDRSGKVRYVGMSSNLYLRWNGKGDRQHHRLEEVEDLDCVLRYRIVAKHRLEYEEAIEIQRFQPDLNRVFPDPDHHRNWQIFLDEIVEGAIAVLFYFILAAAIAQYFGFPVVSTIQAKIEEARSR